MTPESSPFTPGQPVPIEFFVGRLAEVERLRSLVRGSCQGRFKIGFVTGERGIGKSSLVSFVRHLCEREDDVAGAHVFLGGVSDLHEMVRRTFDRLLKESFEKPWHQKLVSFFGKHVRQVGLFGISLELSLGKEELRTAVEDFVPALHNLVAQVKDDRKALLLIMDDINGLADTRQFADWIKSTVDEISTGNQPLPVCLLIVGLEERRQSLISMQPSLARVFDLVEITPWTPQETADFFVRTFASASATLEKGVVEEMASFAGGLPVLAHEIGDAVWRAAKGNKISMSDATTGVLNAAEVIGRKLVEPQILQAIRSERYRSILRKLAKSPLEFSFRRSQVRDHLSPDETRVFDNFLTRMKKLGAIAPERDGGQGAYRFTNHLHYLYFCIESQRARQERTPRNG